MGINEPSVTIKNIENAIIDYAWKHDYMIPEPPRDFTGKQIAVIGSGPSGLAAAAQLNKAGHHVVVYERNDEVGGLLRYGIPTMKLSKEVKLLILSVKLSKEIKIVSTIKLNKEVKIVTK